MMIQLLIQFQKYILSTIYIYISFYLWVFQLKVIPKYRWTFLDDTIPLTYPSRDFHTHTHIRARDIRSGRELFPFSIHVSWGDVLEESDASSLPRKMERMREEEKRKREREKEKRWSFFFFWSLASWEREIEISRRWYYVTATVS